MTHRKLIFWWMAVLAVVTLPLSVAWAIENLGGYIAERMYYGNFRDIVSLSFLASAVTFAWLMWLPSKLPGLRFTFSSIVMLSFLLAAALPRPNCDEFIYLHALGKAPLATHGSKGGCE